MFPIKEYIHVCLYTNIETHTIDVYGHMFICPYMYEIFYYSFYFYFAIKILHTVALIT